jgi:hypothetical protein
VAGEAVSSVVVTRGATLATRQSNPLNFPLVLKSIRPPERDVAWAGQRGPV